MSSFYYCTYGVSRAVLLPRALPPMPRGTNTEKSGAPANLKPGLPTTGDANWLFEDESRLIEFLVENIAEAGDNKNFTMKTFRACADHLELTRTKGGPKTAKSCAQKYSNVRGTEFLIYIYDLSPDFSFENSRGSLTSSRQSPAGNGVTKRALTSISLPRTLGMTGFWYIPMGSGSVTRAGLTTTAWCP